MFSPPPSGVEKLSPIRARAKMDLARLVTLDGWTSLRHLRKILLTARNASLHIDFFTDPMLLNCLCPVLIHSCPVGNVFLYLTASKDKETLCCNQIYL